jgi:lantibiotic modifying enzyme
LLRAPELEKAGRQLALRTVRDSAIRAEYDLLQGHAGEIVGWLSLSRHFGDERFRRAAVRVGEHLLTTAEVEKGTLSWGGIPKWPNLVGFAHGAAGVGYGLLELFQATGDVRFREAALSAFAYERGWFNATEQNWPDLTGSPGKKDASTAAHSYLSHWCHGAPGIAVSRLRAFSQLGLEELKTEATIALETTERSIGSWLGTGGGNFSLCHGLAGNDDVLLMANDILGPSRHRTELIRRVAGTGVEKHAVTETPWPCGAGEPGTQIPSLFLGLAGIGYFYLRLAGKGVPSLLSFGSSADEVTI